MLRFADVVNAQQIVQWQWAWDARQISRQSTIPIAHFHFPFFQRFATVGRRKCSRPETDAMSYHSGSRSPRSLRNALIRGFFCHPRCVITHERILTLPEAIFESL